MYVAPLFVTPENSKYKDDFIKVADKTYYVKGKKWFTLETVGEEDVKVPMIFNPILRSDVGGPERLLNNERYVFFSDFRGLIQAQRRRADRHADKYIGGFYCAFIKVNEFCQEVVL